MASEWPVHSSFSVVVVVARLLVACLLVVLVVEAFSTVAAASISGVAVCASMGEVEGVPPRVWSSLICLRVPPSPDAFQGTSGSVPAGMVCPEEQ